MGKPVNWDSIIPEDQEKWKAYQCKMRKARYRARKNGEPKLKPGAKHKHQWMQIDWDSPTNDIAKLLGVWPSSVTKARRIYAPQTLRKRGTPNKWQELGFISAKDYKNHTERKRRNNLSPDKKNALLQKQRMRKKYYTLKWKELGFSLFEEWKDWKRKKLIESTCKKCGQNKRLYLVKTSGRIRNKTSCPRCKNEAGKELTRKFPGRYKESGKRRRQLLLDDYVSDLLNLPITTAKKYPDLIEAKRDQIKILRELKPTTRTPKQQCTRTQATYPKSAITSQKPHTPHGLTNLLSIELSSWSTPWVRQLTQLLLKSKPQR